MNPRELFLLSPHRLPAQNSVILDNADVEAFLNGHAALWHPAALRGATGPPSIASPYDHELPTAGHIYVVPESPPAFLPDDWEQRVAQAEAVAFRSTSDRDATLSRLREVLPPDDDALFDLPPEQVRPFFGIGFGYLLLLGLFDAMAHDNVLDTADFWQDVQAAVGAIAQGDANTCRQHLQSAAARLLTAREVLYPATIYLLDVCLLDDQHLGQPLPATFDNGLPLSVIASGSVLEKLAQVSPERLAAIRAGVQAEQLEVLGGCYVEREDALLPVESQLWNLLKGLTVSRELLGSDVRVYARERSAAHPQLPLLLNSVGLQRALLVAFDDAVLPSYRTTVVNWPSPDGKQVEAFTRTPYRADNPQTGFHAAHYLHQTIMQDHAATLALVHAGTPAGPWYHDWLELSRFGPVMGQWTTFTRYFNDVMAGEYVSAGAADDFHTDYLSQRTSAGRDQPVSWFAHQVRLRRRIDTAWTLLALHRGLAGKNDPLQLAARLAVLEDQAELGQPVAQDLIKLQDEAAEALAARLQARAEGGQPGYLILNPCSFARRVALEREGQGRPLPIVGPVKACQVEGNQLRLVVEVPALGFAWVPQSGPPGTPAQPLRMRLADEWHVRNEFLEAEIDPVTGGLRGLWDRRTQLNRIAQQLVWKPGSTMRASAVTLTSAGPALGEVITEGAIVGEQDQVLAKFRQRFRAWLGRPLLEVRIEIYPEHLPEGYPWHSYYAARFAWRDERALLLRGLNGTGSITSHTRPETPDYLEIRAGRQSTVLFPGGLPFQQRHESRMVDVILLPKGETARTFDLALALDREHPMQTALGMVTPVPLVTTDKGPPHVGLSGWLFHLDAPNILLTSLRPGPDGSDSVTARLLECGLYSGQAEFRCVRNPQRAALLDARGETLMTANVHEDAVDFEVAQGDLLHLRAEFE